MNNRDSVIEIHRLFLAFRKKFRHVWEEYSFVVFYESHIHQAIKNESFPPFEFIPFLAASSNIQNAGREKSMSVLGQVSKNSIANRVLLDAIGAFEDLLGKVAVIVYLDFPGKLQGSDSPSEATELKLGRLIVESNSREEMLERMAEEKVRSVFYGNPVNIFKKDTARLGIPNNTFEAFPSLFNEYAEITARRNIVVHNSGRVDRKYIRENDSTSYKLGQLAVVDQAYLRRTLCILEGIASVALEAIIKTNYRGTVKGKLAESLKSFNLGVGGSV